MRLRAWYAKQRKLTPLEDDQEVGLCDLCIQAILDFSTTQEGLLVLPQYYANTKVELIPCMCST